MSDTIKLKSGKEVYANRLLVSVIKENGEWQLFNGYDSDISLDRYLEETNDYEPDFTKEELVELSEIIINRWFEFVRAVLSGEIKTRT